MLTLSEDYSEAKEEETTVGAQRWPIRRFSNLEQFSFQRSLTLLLLRKNRSSGYSLLIRTS